jgi:hypothetical protein
MPQPEERPELYNQCNSYDSFDTESCIIAKVIPMKHGAALDQPFLLIIHILHSGRDDLRDDDDRQQQITDDAERRDQIALVWAKSADTLKTDAFDFVPFCCCYDSAWRISNPTLTWDALVDDNPQRSPATHQTCLPYERRKGKSPWPSISQTRQSAALYGRRRGVWRVFQRCFLTLDTHLLEQQYRRAIVF